MSFALLPVCLPAHHPPGLTRQDVVSLVEDGDLNKPLPVSWMFEQCTGSISSEGRKKRPAHVLVVDEAPGRLERGRLAPVIKLRVRPFIHLGDTVSFHLVMSCQSASTAKVQVRLLDPNDPEQKLIDLPIFVRSQSHEFRFAAESKRQYLPGEAQFSIQLDPAIGRYEIHSLRVEDLGDAAPTSVKTEDGSKSPASRRRSPRTSR